jgi:hypothetical protein
MNNDLSILEVCLDSGYNNLSHFNKQFKKIPVCHLPNTAKNSPHCREQDSITGSTGNSVETGLNYCKKNG